MSDFELIVNKWIEIKEYLNKFDSRPSLTKFHLCAVKEVSLFAYFSIFRKASASSLSPCFLYFLEIAYLFATLS